MKLAINLATRGRPQLLASTLRTTLNNITETNTRLMVSLDDDDTESIQVVTSMAKLDGRLIASVKPREDTVAEKWNRILSKAALDEYDVLMPMCDDGPVITPGFDAKILDAAALFPDGIGVVTNYLENLTFPGIQAVTRKLAGLMGYIYPPFWPYWFVDHWLLDITRMIGRDAFADVRLDCETNRPPTQEMREPAMWATLYDVLYLRRREQAAHIINAMDEPEWRKLMLIERMEVHDQHSRMINDIVRHRMGTVVGPASDERYSRLRAKAIEMMGAECEAIERQKAAA